MSGGQKLMYVVVDGYPCVQLLNLSGEIGCSNPGLNKVVGPILKLKDVKDLLQPHTILVTAAAMEYFFTKVSSDLSFASKIESGISAVQEILSKKKGKHETYTSDVVEFNMVMETTKAGTHNSEACWQDRTCLPLGRYSVWSSLPPISVSSSKNRKPVVLIVASMDYASFFRDKIFGAYSPITGMVALLGVVDGFGNLKKQLVYLVLTGEAWGDLGRRRFLHELNLHSDVVAKYNGNQTACQACDEMTQSRHKNLKLQKEKKSVASKSWRFKYKYHNDMANRLVIEAIQEI